MHVKHSLRSAAFPAMLALLLITACCYAPAVNFGFMWDDPLWYGRVMEKPLGDLVKPMPDYQFYRPGTMLYNRFFLRSDDTFSAPLMHAAQIGWHLINVALVFALGRRLGLRRWAALAAGGLVAWYPFSHQAVAWAAPQQPMVAVLQNGAWLVYLKARRRRASWLASSLSLLLFLGALAMQESTVVLAVLPLLMEWMLHRRRTNGTVQTRRFVPWLALIYPLVAAVFGLLWLQLPRQADVTSLNLKLSAIAYFAQGFVFPLLGRPGGYAPGRTFPPGALLMLAGLILVGLLVASWRTGRGRQALGGLIWASLGIIPAAVGLQYSYVRLASRLFYYSSPGIALLWACALLPPKDRLLARRLWRAGGFVLLGLVMLQSLLLLNGFQRMYAVGTDHLAELVRVAQSGESRLLFVNFPDRYAPKHPPYPLGYWGITLAPVSVELGAFPASTTGQHPDTISRSMPWLDEDEREAGPYRVDMRGIVAPPDQLYELAHHVDAIYLSRYYPDGTFALQRAGAVSSALPADPASACRLAVYSDTICLRDAQLDLQAEQLNLTLTWISLEAAQPHDTVFVHLGQPGQPPIAQADGDAWLGMLPLTAWQPGDTVREQRIILLPEEILSGQYEIRVGVYNRVTGERLPVTTLQGEPLLDDATVIATLSY